MKKTFKIIAIILGVLVVLIAAAAIIAPMVFDPNDYKDDIAKAVQKSTGRELRIPGKIDLSVFPWLGVQLGEVELGNAEGFGPKPMAKVASADVRVKLLPLLRKHIELGTVSLHGLQLNLSRNAQGRTNWADLVPPAGAAPAQKTKKPAPAKAGGGAPIAALAVGGLDISDASVVWDDRQSGQHVSIDHLQLDSGALAPGEPFPLKLSMDIASRAPAVKGHLSLAGRMNVDVAGERYRADGLNLAAELSGAGLPGGQAKARLEADAVAADLEAQSLQAKGLTITAPGLTLTGHATGSRILGQAELVGQLDAKVDDGAALLKAAGAAKALPNPGALDGASLALPFRVSLAQQDASVKPLRLQWQGLTLTAELQAAHITSAPQLSGEISTDTFSPRRLAEAAKLALPPMADAKALGKASLKAHFDASTRAASVKDLKLALDESTLTGEASARDFAKPVVRFKLALDRIDADRYLPPPAKGGAASGGKAAPATPGQAAAGAAAQLPLKQLRSLDLQGSLHIGRLKIAKLNASDIRFNARAQNGHLSLSPLSAKMYQGRYAGNLGLDVSTKTPRLSADESLSGVQIGPLLKDLNGKDPLLGKADLKARVHAEGLDATRIRKTLNGRASFSVDNATLKNVNIPYEVCKAYALIKRLPAPPKSDNKTDFTNISGSATITDGLAHNKDLKADSALLKVKGQGTANLVSEALDYDTTVTLVKALKCTPQADLTDLKFVDIPMHVGGTFSSPSVRLDIAKALQAKVKQKVEQKKEEVRQKAKEKVKKELQDKLKNLFK